MKPLEQSEVGGTPRVGVTLGDPLGIGPEIVAKACADARVKAAARVRVYGDASGFVIGPTSRSGGAATATLCDGGVTTPPRGPTRDGGGASLAWVEDAIGDAKRDPSDPRAIDAIVTGPISKEAWVLAGVDAARWAGHTELLAERFESPASGMLFAGPRLRVILATVHIPLREVAGRLSTARVRECIDLGERACRELGVQQPRIAVAGLNPHAGEGGVLGTEDGAVIAPAVEAARREGVDVVGPLPGDVVFLKAAGGAFDLVVAMYHDQGLIPVKLLDREKSVNMTVGLSWRGRKIVRTSPAHGTAYDIAGRGVANAESMIEAILLAARVAGTKRS